MKVATSQNQLEPAGAGGGQGKILSWSLQREDSPTDTSRSDFPDQGENAFLLPAAPQSVVLCDGGPGKLSQHLTLVQFLNDRRLTHTLPCTHKCHSVQGGVNIW